MIVDKLKNLHLYKGLHKNFDTVLDYIAKTDLLKVPVGKHEIDGKEVFLLRESYDTRGLESCYFEQHENYADIQLVLTGAEYMGYNNIENTKGVIVTDPYNSEKDVCKSQIKKFTKVILNDQMFALVLPQDQHMPKLKMGKPVHVEKAVFKVKIK